MNIKKQFSNKAFSLLELSATIIIISVLMAGIFSGGRMIAQSKLKSAQALTKSSSIYSIPDLKLWLETSLNNSIVGDVNGFDISNNEEVSAWNDISGNKINVIQETQGNQPLYLLSGINNLPSINFDGNDDYLFSTSKVPLSPGDDNFTFVVVWNRISNNSTPGIILDQNNNGLSVPGKRAGIRTKGSNGKYGFEGDGSTEGSGNNFFNVNYTYGSPVISVITIETDGIIKFYTNSKDIATSGSIDITVQNIADDIFVIGARGTATKIHHFPGQLSEIMVFDRDLRPTEIAVIVNYLSKKYNITLS